MERDDCFWHPGEGHTEEDCPGADAHLAEYGVIVGEILDTMEMSEAYITDQSAVSDFPDDCIDKLVERFGFEVVHRNSRFQLIWELAKTIHESRKGSVG